MVAQGSSPPFPKCSPAAPCEMLSGFRHLVDEVLELNRGGCTVAQFVHSISPTTEMGIEQFVRSISSTTEMGVKQLVRYRAISQRNGLYICTHLLLKIDYVLIGSK